MLQWEYEARKLVDELEKATRAERPHVIVLSDAKEYLTQELAKRLAASNDPSDLLLRWE